MVGMKRLSLFLCLLIPVLVAAQGEVIFSGRIVDAVTGAAVPGMRVRIVGQGEGVTDDDGLFRIPVKKGTVEVKLELSGEWTVQYPREGKALVPMSSEARIDFEVKRLRSENAMLLQEVARLKKEGKLKTAQIDSLRQVVENSLGRFQEELARAAGSYRDSLRRSTEETAALRRKIAELTDRLEQDFIRRNKAEAVALISSELLTYLDRLKDLRDFLPHIRDVFLDSRASENFNTAVNRYNAARGPINDNREGRLASARLYWQDALTADELEEAYTLILTGIHARIILPLNNELVDHIRAAATGNMPRVAASKKAKDAADAAFKTLDYPIRELEQKISEVNVRLKGGN